MDLIPSSQQSLASKYAGYASAAASAIQRAWRRRNKSMVNFKPRLSTAVKKKLASKTLTQTRRKEGHVINEGVAGQYSEFRYKAPYSWIPKAAMKAAAPLCYVTNVGQAQGVGIGVQSAARHLLCADTQTILNWDSASKVLRVVIDRVVAETYMANPYKGNCRVTIYDCIAREDIGNSNVSDPYQAWNQGLTDVSLTGTVTTVGTVPTDSEAFNKYWKILQRTETVIAGGADHRHKVFLKLNKLVTGAEATYSYAMRGITYACLVVVTGQPAHDSTTKSTVSLGVGGVDYVTQVETYYRYLNGNTTQVTRSNTLVNTFPVGEVEAYVGGPTQGANANA